MGRASEMGDAWERLSGKKIQAAGLRSMRFNSVAFSRDGTRLIRHRQTGNDPSMSV